MTTLQFSIRVDGVSDESLVVRSYQGQDNFSSVQQADGTWCHGFRYQIELASRRPDLTALDMVDKSAELVMHRDGEIVQRINGIVRNFTQGETGHHHTFYSLTLVPEIERLSLRHNSRIFQSISAPDIIATLFKEMDIQDFAFALTRTPKQREFCMQYRETDLEFINRLAAEEGMVYYIEQSKGKHSVLFSDDSQVISSLDFPIPYNVMPRGISSKPYIKEFSKTTQFEVSETHSGDSSFKKPQYTFSQQAVASDIDYQRDTYQHFNAPGRFKDDAIGKEFNQLRLDSLHRSAHTAKGKSNEPQLQTGAKFELSEHSDDGFNKKWLVITSTHQGEQPQALEESAGSKPTTYANQFEAIPADKTWRMPQMTFPQVDGPMTAYVVGPDGEEIFCDEYGRVKLHFPWDRYSNGDEHSSCWVQVSQGWAGSQYGQIAIPRIGHEVIVSFLNGDPDQPIVTGRAFNTQNLPPYTLPDNKTKTVWRSESHQGEGFNEISFEDQSGSEQIYVHAQKDFKSETLNDHITDVNNDQHLTVENDQFTQIKNNHNLTVEGESVTYVKGDLSQEVVGSIQQKVGSIHVMEAGKEVSLTSGGKLVVEAGSEVTLKVGGSFVKVDAAGVHLVGASVNINSGGSAGSASKYSAQSAMLPKGIEPVAPPQPPLPIAARSFIVAETAGVSTVKPCPLATNSSTSTELSNETDSAKADSQEQAETILQSDLLKPSATLNQLAEGSSTAYRKGDKGAEIKLIQQALIQLGFDLGKYGADGDFGSTTERQVKAFQQNYQATHKIHSSYQVGQVDGIVGKGTILGLDEAVVVGWSYSNEGELITFEELKLIMGNLDDDRVNLFLEPINITLRTFDIDTPLRIAHFLSQIAHETNNLYYMEEIASGQAYEHRSDLGNTEVGDGKRFKGRGLLQLTGRDNYRKCQTYLNGLDEYAGLDITSNTELASKVAQDIELACLVSGYYWRYIKPKLNQAADRDDIFWVSVYINGWARQSKPVYVDKPREPNHMQDRINKLNHTKGVLGL